LESATKLKQSISEVILQDDFLLGKLHLDEGEKVPFVDLQKIKKFFLGSNVKQIGQGLFVTEFLDLNETDVVIPGYPAGEFELSSSYLIAAEGTGRAYLASIEGTKIQTGSSGSPVLHSDGSLLGILISTGGGAGVVLTRELIL